MYVFFSFSGQSAFPKVQQNKFGNNINQQQKPNRQKKPQNKKDNKNN